jgi:hypothetical protein
MVEFNPGVIVQVDAVDSDNGPSVSKFQIDRPDTDGEIVKDRTANGIILLLAELAALSPSTLVALTVKEYEVPVVKPLKDKGEAPVAVILPGEEVAV